MMSTSWEQLGSYSLERMLNLHKNPGNTNTRVNMYSSEARLVDPDTGKDAKFGEEGELWVRGPQVMM